jgi:hypothetical protein
MRVFFEWMCVWFEGVRVGIQSLFELVHS